MPEIFFVHPNTLFGRGQEVLNRVGAKKFFSDPNEEVKKAREGFAGYFFTLVLKKATKRDWWLAQIKREFPDFDLMSFTENLEDIILEQVELVTIPDRFKNYEEMMSIVQGKLTSYSDPKNINLLIFVNHVKSEEWIRLLNDGLTSNPFKSIWTIHFLFKNGKEIKRVIAHKLRPFPVLKVDVDTDETELYRPQLLPKYLEETKRDGKTFVIPKPNSVNEFIKNIKRAKLQ